MIKSITVKNYLNESLTIELTRPEKSGFIVKNITGLGPDKADVNITEVVTRDGGIFNSARKTTRNIVMQLEFTYDPQLTDVGLYSIEDCRHRSYQYFPLKRKVSLDILTDSQELTIDGYVETNEPDIFSQKEGCMISILCTDPFFKSKNKQITQESGSVKAFEFPFSNELVPLTEDDLVLYYNKVDENYKYYLEFDVTINNFFDETTSQRFDIYRFENNAEGVIFDNLEELLSNNNLLISLSFAPQYGNLRHCQIELDTYEKYINGEYYLVFSRFSNKYIDLTISNFSIHTTIENGNYEKVSDYYLDLNWNIIKLRSFNNNIWEPFIFINRDIIINRQLNDVRINSSLSELRRTDVSILNLKSIYYTDYFKLYDHKMVLSFRIFADNNEDYYSSINKLKNTFTSNDDFYMHHIIPNDVEDNPNNYVKLLYTTYISGYDSVTTTGVTDDELIFEKKKIKEVIFQKNSDMIDSVDDFVLTDNNIYDEFIEYDLDAYDYLSMPIYLFISYEDIYGNKYEKEINRYTNVFLLYDVSDIDSNENTRFIKDPTNHLYLHRNPKNRIESTYKPITNDNIMKDELLINRTYPSYRFEKDGKMYDLQASKGIEFGYLQKYTFPVKLFYDGTIETGFIMTIEFLYSMPLETIDDKQTYGYIVIRDPRYYNKKLVIDLDKIESYLPTYTNNWMHKRSTSGETSGPITPDGPIEKPKYTFVDDSKVPDNVKKVDLRAEVGKIGDVLTIDTRRGNKNIYYEYNRDLVKKGLFDMDGNEWIILYAERGVVNKEYTIDEVPYRKKRDRISTLFALNNDREWFQIGPGYNELQVYHTFYPDTINITEDEKDLVHANYLDVQIVNDILHEGV